MSISTPYDKKEVKKVICDNEARIDMEKNQKQNKIK